METNSREPFFGPDSVAWQIHREAILLLGGPRALLLQLAHPLVAQGVADHSRVLEDALGRLRATLDAMLGIVFGDRRTAEEIAERIRSTHERVRGELREPTEHYPARTPYRATDPSLLLWVHATLVDSTLELYERFVAPLGSARSARYYEETKRIALLLGIPSKSLPASFPGFERYFQSILEGPELEVTPTAKRMADAVLHPPLPLLPRLAGGAASIVTAELLPAPLRDRYGFSEGAGARRSARALLRLVGTTLPLLPRATRDLPHARRAFRRWSPPKVAPAG